MSLDELSSALGRQPTRGSHSKGDPRPGPALAAEVWPVTVWRCDSNTNASASIQEHLKNLNLRYPPSDLSRRLPTGCEVIVDVAIFFDTINITADLSPQAIQLIQSYRARLEISCYPSELATDDASG